MQLLMSKNKAISLDGVELFRNFRRDICALKPSGEGSIYSKETSLAIMDICDAAESMYLGELTMQQAVDLVLGGHYQRTKDWDGLSQEITDSVIQSLIVKFFGKPL
jgi:hypothetical protein